jgi:hypothetical protein
MTEDVPPERFVNALAGQVGHHLFAHEAGFEPATTARVF